jgi:hypothetical protein
MLDGEFSDIFILKSTQNQNWNLRRRAKETIEGADSMTVSEIQISQHCRDAIWAVALLLSRLDESLEALNTVFNPFHFVDKVVRASQRLANRGGVGQVVLDQQDVLRHPRSFCISKPREY